MAGQGHRRYLITGSLFVAGIGIGLGFAITQSSSSPAAAPSRPPVATTTLSASALPSGLSNAISGLGSGMRPASTVVETHFPAWSSTQLTSAFSMWMWASPTGQHMEADGTAAGQAPSLASCGSTAGVQACNGGSHGNVGSHGDVGIQLGTKDAGITSIAVSVGGTTTDAALDQNASGSSGWIVDWSNPSGNPAATVTVTVTDSSGASATATASNGAVTGSSGASAYRAGASAVAKSVSAGVGLRLP